MEYRENRLEYSDKYRYHIHVIDTLTDEEVDVRHAKNLEGVKRNISRALKDLGLPRRYDNTGKYVIFVKDAEFFTRKGTQKVSRICYYDKLLRNYILIDNQEVLEERGIDFDIWHDNYLTEEERAEYDAIRTH